MKNITVLLLLLIGILYTPKVFSQADDSECRSNFSLYREYFKQENYKEAYPYWRWVFKNCPSMSQYTYTNGTEMLKSIISQTTDQTLKQKLTDTLMMVWDQRYQYYPKSKDGQDQRGNYVSRQALDLLEIDPTAKERAFELLDSALAIEGINAEPRVIQDYFNLAIDLAKNNIVEKSVIIDGYEDLIDILEQRVNIEKDSTEYKKIVTVKSNIETEFEPYATCETLIDIYQKRFDQTPEDIEMLKRITNMLVKKRCVNNDLFMKATENLNRLEPSAESAWYMANLMIKQEKLSDAATYLNQALNLYKDEYKKMDAYYTLGLVYINTGKYPQARDMGRKMLEINPNSGKAYILIADAYAAGSVSNGTDEVSKYGGYWAAIDKLYTAIKVDPSVEKMARQNIGRFSSAFPDKERLFFNDIKEGSSYRVGGWINETTTVRGK